MTTIEIAALEETLSAAFQGGELRRWELRLTAEEAEYLALHWEGVRLTPSPLRGTRRGILWS